MRPDVVLEQSWRNGITDFAMPYFIQVILFDRSVFLIWLDLPRNVTPNREIRNGGGESNIGRREKEGRARTTYHDGTTTTHDCRRRSLCRTTSSGKIYDVIIEYFRNNDVIVAFFLKLWRHHSIFGVITLSYHFFGIMTSSKHFWKNDVIVFKIVSVTKINCYFRIPLVSQVCNLACNLVCNRAWTPACNLVWVCPDSMVWAADSNKLLLSSTFI